jgi:hypothetical protein
MQSVSTWPPRRLPAAPLLAEIGARLADGGVTCNRLLGSRGRHAYMRARAEGTITARTAAQLCAVLGREPRELYGAAYDAALRPPPVLDRHAGIRLDAGPLLAAIEARCRARGVKPWRYLEQDQRRAYERAKHDGIITLRAVEQFCDVQGWHPRELYGDSYDAAALAGCPAGYDPWEAA